MKRQHWGLDAEGEAQEGGAGEATQGRSGQSMVQSLYLKGVTERGRMESFIVLSERWRWEVRKQPQEALGRQELAQKAWYSSQIFKATLFILAPAESHLSTCQPWSG